MSEDRNLRELLIQATKDPALRTKFLSNPEAVAKEYKVKLKPDQLEKVKKAAAFIDSLNEIRLPPGPIIYPLDPVVNQWKVAELTDVIRYYFMRRWRWIIYPAPPWLRRRDDIPNMGRLRE